MPTKPLNFCVFRRQLSEALGVPVLGIGRADGDGDCGDCRECCCRPQVEISEGFYLVHALSDTLVGPALHMDPNCICLDNSNSSYAWGTVDNIKLNNSNTVEEGELFPTHQNKNKTRIPVVETNHITEEPPFAYAMINQNVNGKLTECLQNSCHNGGRCIPSDPGYK